MGLYSIFSQLKKAESEAARLYSTLSTRIAHQYPDLAQFLKTLSEEEKIHEKRVEMFKNLFFEAHDFFLEKPDAESILAETLKKIEDVNTYFLQNADILTPQRIIQIIAELEKDMENKHHTLFVEVTDAGLKQLMENLESGDKAHSEGLNAFLARYT